MSENVFRKKSFPFEFMTCDQWDEDIFKRQCVALENGIPGLVKGKLLQDVGTDYQAYRLGDADVLVENNEEVGGVFVRSDVDLKVYFKEPPSKGRDSLISNNKEGGNVR